MDNIQLAILLKRYLSSLSEAVERVEEDLPESEKVEGTNALNMRVERFPILDPLHKVLDELYDDIEMLKADRGE